MNLTWGAIRGLVAQAAEILRVWGGKGVPTD